jgi:hypothetical protein
VSCLTTKDHYNGAGCLRGDITWDLDDFKLEAAVGIEVYGENFMG